MTVFSIKKDASLAVLAFSSANAAQNHGDMRGTFSNFVELASLDLSDEELRTLHYIVKGHETRLTDREWLSEIIYNALIDANLPITDDGSEEPEAVIEPEAEIVAPLPVEAATEASPEYDVPDDEPDPEQQEIEEIAIDFGALVRELQNFDLDYESDNEIDSEPLTLIEKSRLFKLNPRPTTKYSRREKLVFELLVNKYPEMTTTHEILDTAFRHNKSFHIKNSVVMSISNLKRKAEHNKEPFRIMTTSNSGPYPMKVWIKLKRGRRSKNASDVWRTKDENA